MGYGVRSNDWVKWIVGAMIFLLIAAVVVGLVIADTYWANPPMWEVERPAQTPARRAFQVSGPRLSTQRTAWFFLREMASVGALRRRCPTGCEAPLHHQFLGDRVHRIE